MFTGVLFFFVVMKVLAAQASESMFARNRTRCVLRVHVRHEACGLFHVCSLLCGEIRVSSGRVEGIGQGSSGSLCPASPRPFFGADGLAGFPLSAAVAGGVRGPISLWSDAEGTPRVKTAKKTTNKQTKKHGRARPASKLLTFSREGETLLGAEK